MFYTEVPKLSLLPQLTAALSQYAKNKKDQFAHHHNLVRAFVVHLQILPHPHLRVGFEDNFEDKAIFVKSLKNIFKSYINTISATIV